MLKRRAALYLALLGATLTILFGFSQDVRILTIAYRTAVSTIVFGICGYLFGGMLEEILRKLLAKLNSTGQHVDIIAKDEPDASSPSAQPPNINGSDTNFDPFSPDNFEHISGAQ